MTDFSSPLPLLPLRHGVVLPSRRATIPVGRPRSRALVEALSSDALVLLAVQRDPAIDDPSLVDLHPIATLARVVDRTDRGARGVILVVDALSRASLASLSASTPYWTARAQPIEEPAASAEAVELMQQIKARLRELVPSDRALTEVLASTDEPGVLADRVASWIEVEDVRKVEALLTIEPEARLRLVVQLLAEARAKHEVRARIESEVRKEFGKNHKEAMLRQQLKAIQRELGEDGDGAKDKLREKLEQATLPDDVREVVTRELRRLDQVGGNQAEANVIRTYLEWIAELPWAARADARTDLDAVEAALEADHYGLEDVKRRILEHMAVLALGGEGKGTILALVGPPGVGKTSLAQSVADATGRPLVRVSLGGVRDEAEIRGHRRTYVGALPGRVVHALRKAKVKNPVIVIDELDKLGKGGFQGDPEAALLEVLDPEQNATFTDHYLELPFDLSEVLFIATANDLGPLSSPLRDRLEVIEVSGYTTEEKLEIAERHLLEHERRRVGLPEGAVTFPRPLIELVVREYTREAGVRQLGRELGKVLRSVALEVARKRREASAITIDEARVREALGKPRYFSELAEKSNAPGVAAGLAWTPTGGDILFIETTKMAGKGHVEITGQLGDVMKESVRAALAYLRSHAEALGIDPAFLERNDLHVHVPAGAIPKDGPSAGITMFTALASLLTGRRVRGDVAMTGEVTLRGRVLPIGGLKSKLLAAHRAGFGRVIIPKQNERDLVEVPESVRDELEILLAEDVAEVLAAALEPDALGPDASASGPQELRTRSSGAGEPPLSARH